MYSFMAVFLGGGIGSVFRWGICCKISNHWGTMLVNVIGAFLIGYLFEYISLRSGFKPEMKVFLMTGLLGGFTTFSTYLLDFVVLANRGEMLEGVLYLLLSVIIGTVFLVAGMKLVSVVYG